MSDTRTLNMEKRRERILEEARKTLALGGFDALNLRDLAEVSGVTVPTIYNLIGNKAEVLKALVLDSFATFEADLERKLPCATEDLPAVMMSTLEEMIGADEDSFRATALAGERLENESQEHADYGFKRAPLRKFAGRLFVTARQEGLLRGKIDSELLVEQTLGNHERAFRDWAHREITLRELTKQSLSGFYIALAADARDDYRDRIAARLKKL
jgi:AcrR family transcriptional regulator